MKMGLVYSSYILYICVCVCGLHHCLAWRIDYLSVHTGYLICYCIILLIFQNAKISIILVFLLLCHYLGDRIVFSVTFRRSSSSSFSYSDCSFWMCWLYGWRSSPTSNARLIEMLWRGQFSAQNTFIMVSWGGEDRLLCLLVSDTRSVVPRVYSGSWRRSTRMMAASGVTGRTSHRPPLLLPDYNRPLSCSHTCWWLLCWRENAWHASSASHPLCLHIHHNPSSSSLYNTVYNIKLTYKHIKPKNKPDTTTDSRTHTYTSARHLTTIVSLWLPWQRICPTSRRNHRPAWKLR